MNINVILERVTLRRMTCLYLLSFLEILKHKKNKMCCAFINFEKAFDKVWRDGLWYKLLLNNMNDNMHNIIVNMYTYCISYNDCKSECVPCSNGVRHQGENVSYFFLSGSWMTLHHTWQTAITMDYKRFLMKLKSILLYIWGFL